MKHVERDTPTFVRQAEEVFFNLVGMYADPSKKPEIVGNFPGDKSTKRFVWPENGRPNKAGWLAIDTWTSGEDGSFGNTVLYHDGVPIWHMSYEGHYSKDVIPFLKEALTETYGAKRFVGARGPHEHMNERYHYWNRDNGDFSRFSGKEQISVFESGFWEPQGQHSYRGGFM